MESNWLKFERLIKNIQHSLAPEAKVTHNEMLIGKSGVKHQCDVVLRANIGQYEFLCIFEAKDLNKNVGIEVIGGFWSKVEDVGAKQGVIVSAKGFTKKAVQLASNKEIILYKLVDAQSAKWKDEALIPIQVTQIYLKEARGQMFNPETNEPIGLVNANGNPVPNDQTYLFDIKRNKYLKLQGFLEEKWDEIFKDKIPLDEGNLFETEKTRYLLYAGKEKQFPVVIHFSFTPETDYYYGRLSLTKCQGFVNQKSGELLTDEFVTTPLMFDEVLKKWPSTKDQEKVPFKALLYFWRVRCFSTGEYCAPEGVVIRAFNRRLVDTKGYNPHTW